MDDSRPSDTEPSDTTPINAAAGPSAGAATGGTHPSRYPTPPDPVRVLAARREILVAHQTAIAVDKNVVICLTINGIAYQPDNEEQTMRLHKAAFKTVSDELAAVNKAIKAEIAKELPLEAGASA